MLVSLFEPPAPVEWAACSLCREPLVLPDTHEPRFCRRCALYGEQLREDYRLACAPYEGLRAASVPIVALRLRRNG